MIFFINKKYWRNIEDEIKTFAAAQTVEIRGLQCNGRPRWERIQGLGDIQFFRTPVEP